MNYEGRKPRSRYDGKGAKGFPSQELGAAQDEDTPVQEDSHRIVQILVKQAMMPVNLHDRCPDRVPNPCQG